MDSSGVSTLEDSPNPKASMSARAIGELLSFVTGGAATCIAAGPLISFGIAVDDTSVYWTGNSDGTVMKAPK
jgi:hypothetical protein